MLDPEQHERLAIIAEYRDIQLAELAARLLEKAIVAEWHEVSILLGRSARLGKRWKALEGRSEQGDLWGAERVTQPAKERK